MKAKDPHCFSFSMFFPPWKCFKREDRRAESPTRVEGVCFSVFERGVGERVLSWEGKMIKSKGDRERNIEHV